MKWCYLSLYYLVEQNGEEHDTNINKTHPVHTNTLQGCSNY